MEKPCILLAEDEEDIAKIEKSYLERAGYEVQLACDGETALRIALESSPDLLLLDLMLPKKSGEEVLRAVRAHSSLPVIIVSAKSEENDRISGLQHGADDYLTKPFSPRELVERVRAVLRRTENTARAGILYTADGRLRIDLDRAQVKKDGQEIHLTKNEFSILWTLFSHPGKIYTREEIIETTFGIDYDAYDRAIDTHIKNIRQKIEDSPRKPVYIKTLYGLGYQAGGMNEPKDGTQ